MRVHIPSVLMALSIAPACAREAPRSMPAPPADPWVVLPLTAAELAASRRAASNDQVSTRAASPVPPPQPPSEPSKSRAPDNPDVGVVLDDPNDDPAPLVRALAVLTIEGFRRSRCCDNPGGLRCDGRHLEVVFRVEGGRVAGITFGHTPPSDRELAHCIADGLVGRPLSWNGLGATVSEKLGVIGAR